MAGASPATTIDGYKSPLRRIVVAGLAPAMQKNDEHLLVEVDIGLLGVMIQALNTKHRSQRRLRPMLCVQCLDHHA